MCRDRTCGSCPHCIPGHRDEDGGGDQSPHLERCPFSECTGDRLRVIDTIPPANRAGYFVREFQCLECRRLSAVFFRDDRAGLLEEWPYGPYGDDDDRHSFVRDWLTRGPDPGELV